MIYYTKQQRLTGNKTNMEIKTQDVYLPVGTSQFRVLEKFSNYSIMRCYVQKYENMVVMQLEQYEENIKDAKKEGYTAGCLDVSHSHINNTD
jgi:hypothetical protein